MNDVDDFQAHAQELQSRYSSLRLSEADTRSYLIDPVLRILGYAGVEHLRREVNVPATKESIDYELLVAGEAQAIVEAKAIRQQITDQHAAQCVQYAAILGVRWCLITNGIEWRLYDAHAKGPLSDKHIASVRLDGDEAAIGRAWGMLSLFARESLERSTPISGLLVERVVIDELGDPQSAAVSALRRAVQSRFGERVAPGAIVAELKRLMSLVESVPSASPETSSEPADKQKRQGRTRMTRRSSGQRVSLQELVDAGLLPEGAPIEARVGGISHPARVVGGQIELNGQLYDSPSAASMALREVQSYNGWIDWRYHGETLAVIRERLQRRTDAGQA